MTNKIYDPITKKYVKRKPIKIKMGGGWRKTINGKLIEPSNGILKGNKPARVDID